MTELRLLCFAGAADPKAGEVTAEPLPDLRAVVECSF